MAEFSPQQRRILDRHLNTLLEESNVLEHAMQQQKSVNTSNRGLVSLFFELDAVTKAFPELVQPFEKERYFSHAARDNEEYYNVAGIRAYLANVIGRLRTALSDGESTPVTQSRDFLYVRDGQLRLILQRDYHEIQRAYISRCNKSVIILCGGAIEALLLDRLQQDQSRALATSCAPKKSDLSRWDLADLISVARELNIVSAGVERLAGPVREFRNLIHPGNEVRNRITFGAEEARIAIEILHIVDRDLS